MYDYDKLMIVAHPDDEVIFGGASLILEKGWKVICVTNGGNPVRAKEFRQAMQAVQAKYEIWNFPDRRCGTFNMKLLARILKPKLQERSYRLIVTHNSSGEYGHPQHKALSRLMMQLAPENLFTFYKSKEVAKGFKE